MSNYIELMRAFESFGLLVQDVQFNNIQRCATSDKPRRKNGWYFAFNTPCIGAVFGNWATHERALWIAEQPKRTPEELRAIRKHIKEAQRQRTIEQARQWAHNARSLQKLLNRCKPIAGTPAELYLRNRGIELSSQPNSLLYCESVDYWQNGERLGNYPALIAQVTSPAGELITLHRTYITPDGKKANVATPKKLMKTAGTMKGATIKLARPTLHPNGVLMLGIAEGIETALSASQLYGVPVWAGISASGLMSFEPPADIKLVYFFADNDTNEVGQTMAKNKATALARLGFTCSVCIPEVVGHDWNDELQAIGAQV